MRYPILLLAALLAGGAASAETIVADDGLAVKPPDVPAPTRGMTMDQVASKFGAPATKLPAVGKPPITRWEYPGFVVYFERDYVICSVSGTPAADSTGDSAASSTGANT
jgi:hypothetical protein